MKNILLIGASGFVGSAILKEALARGHNVTALVRNPDRISLVYPNLKVVAANATSAEEVARYAEGMDAVVSAYNPGWKNPNIYQEIMTAYPAILSGTKKAGVGRLLVVGGAGSLNIAQGLTLIASGRIPAAILPGAKGQADVYCRLLVPEKELDWVFFAPAAELTPGERTGVFRLGRNDLVVGADGKSRISVEDYAVAMVDELENEAHHRERFTIGY